VENPKYTFLRIQKPKITASIEKKKLKMSNILSNVLLLKIGLTMITAEILTVYR
jgi:hypothetical protein